MECPWSWLTNQTSFLDGIDFPSISEDTKLDLEKELDGVEITYAIFNIKRGRAAGPDGLPMDIYSIRYLNTNF